MKPIAILTLLGLFCAPACRADTKLPAADPKKLIGTWEIDYEPTWMQSRDAFMNDTMRGADAYPDDVREKATIVKGEMAKLFGGGVCTFGEEGAASMMLGGQSKEGTYEVKSQEGNILEIGLENLLRAKAYAVEFLADDTAVLVLKNKLPIRIVLHRRGGDARAAPEQLEIDEADEAWYERRQKQAEESSGKTEPGADSLEERMRVKEERWRALERAEEQNALMYSLADKLRDYYHEKESYPDSLLELKQGDRRPAFFAVRGPDSFENFVARVEYIAKANPKSRVLVAAEKDAEDNRLVILRDFRVDSMTEEDYVTAVKE